MNKTTDIGIGHLIKAMQNYGFGHEEIKAMQEFLLDNKNNPQNIRLSNARFVDDCYSENWEYNPIIIK
jgi:hypothetical protein